MFRQTNHREDVALSGLCCWRDTAPSSEWQRSTQSRQAGRGFPSAGLRRLTPRTAGCLGKAEGRTHLSSSPPMGPSPCRGTASSATGHRISGTYKPRAGEKQAEACSCRWQAASGAFLSSPQLVQASRVLLPCAAQARRHGIRQARRSHPSAVLPAGLRAHPERQPGSRDVLHHHGEGLAGGRQPGRGPLLCSAPHSRASPHHGPALAAEHTYRPGIPGNTLPFGNHSLPCSQVELPGTRNWAPNPIRFFSGKSSSSPWCSLLLQARSWGRTAAFTLTFPTSAMGDPAGESTWGNLTHKLKTFQGK